MSQIDVLIPTFNRGDMLLEAVESILQQTMKDFRILIYDDGSTDKSVDRLPKDKRIIIERSSENRGIAYARNLLLDLAEAPYCAWQDSDDVSDKKRLQAMLGFLEKTGADMAMSYMYFFTGAWGRKRWRKYTSVDTDKYDPDIDECGVNGNLAHATSVFKRELKQYRVDTNRITGSDYLWIKQLVREGKKFATLKEFLYYARKHPGRTNCTAKSKVRKPS